MQALTPVGQMRYMSYGSSRDDGSALPLDYLFTSQQLDGTIGLYWYASRAYDASLSELAVRPSTQSTRRLASYSYLMPSLLLMIRQRPWASWAGLRALFRPFLKEILQDLARSLRSFPE
jgi:hypothetical protein